jgi:hypothetical protein
MIIFEKIQMNKTIIIFLSNKLVSIDTILPLMFEIKKRNPLIDIKFYTTDFKTFNIIKKNYVLYNGINNIGSINFIGRENKKIIYTFLNRVKYIKLFLKIFFLLLTNKAHIIHFSLLNYFPWKLFYYFNKNNIILFEKTWMTKLEFDVSNIGGRRESTRFSPSKPIAGKIVVFNKDSNYFIDKRINNIPIIMQEKTIRLKSWLEFINSNSQEYLKNEFKDGLKNNIITIMLGTFISPVYLKSKTSVTDCFIETLEVLNKFENNLTVLIKPHAISDPLIYEKIIKSFHKLDIKITYLHPAILAKISNIFISNYYSTTLSVGKAFNIPTIEYTEYSDDALKISNNGSMRPDSVDHFINKDKKKLSLLLKNNIKGKKVVYNFSSISKSLLDALL